MTQVRTKMMEVNGETLTVAMTEDGVTVSRVIGRDRKNKADILWVQSTVDRPTPGALLDTLTKVAAQPTAHCTCDYRYGYSDHAEHCKSIHVAEEPRAESD